MTTDVYGNTVNGNADWGIALFGATNVNIGGTGQGPGEHGLQQRRRRDLPRRTPLRPGASTGNTVAKNTANANGDDGILADGPDISGNQQATGNTFEKNTLQKNIRYDAEDRSTGGGPGTTAGTANAWTGNVCKPANDSNPLGLAAEPPHPVPSRAATGPGRTPGPSDDRRVPFSCGQRPNFRHKSR